MNLKALITSIVSVITVVILTIVGYCCWPMITTTITDNKYYTYDEIQKSYQDGYNNGAKSETELTEQVEYYKALVDEYYNNVNTLNNEISLLSKNNQILKEQIVQLQSTGQEQDATIANLENVIESNQRVVDNLNNQIYTLKKNVKYYEQIIANIELENQVVATFEFDGVICSVQLLSYNAVASEPNVEITPNVTFNGWMVDGETIDLSTYHITKNTRFIANVVYCYNVNFVVEGENIEEQIVVKEQSATLPQAPIKDGYEFDGWSTDGTNIVDVINTPVNTNINYIAVFTKLHQVTFVQDDKTISSLTVRENSYVNVPDLTVPDNMVFNGWLVNNETVAVENYPIKHDTVFVADLSKKESYFEAVSFTVANDKSLSGKSIWTDGENLYYSASKTHLVYNRNTKEWEVKTWNGSFTQFTGSYIWSDGLNTYYSSYLKQYVLNKTTMSWDEKVWGGLQYPNRNEIWTDGTDIYLSTMNPNTNYILNRQNSTWIKISWNGVYNDYFQGSRIWSDGVNTYFSINDYQYVLQKGTDTWTTKTWNGFVPQSALCIWSDKENIYYSDVTNNQFYVLDVTTSTWLPKEWNVYLNPQYFWWDGDTMYYSSAKTHYVLVK